MIQRIQSIFLLIVAIVMIVFLFLPIWNKMDPENMEVLTLNAFELRHEKLEENASTLIAKKDTYWISVVAIFAAGISLFSIFKYNNRLTQMKLGALNSLVMGGTIGLSYFYSYKAGPIIAPGDTGNYQIGFFIVAVALLCNSLANRFIRRDEKLVKSADRIR